MSKGIMVTKDQTGYKWNVKRLIKKKEAADDRNK